MLPENKKGLVKKALQSTFGVSDFDKIEKITTGLSGALVFRMEVKAKAYLLRIIMRTDAMGNPAKHFQYMEDAAKAGIAPKLWYADVEDRLSITDFIEAQPFPVEEAKKKMPELIRKLHQLRAFHKVMDIFQMARMYLQKVEQRTLLPQNEFNAILQAFEKIERVYPVNEEVLVSCHNDLKPENIVYDGLKPWIVDWEASFLNFGLADLSIVANFVVQDEKEERAFLEDYFDRPINEYDSARFFLINQVLHINYCCVFLSILSSTGQELDLKNLPNRSFRAFHSQMWNGQISLAENQNRLEYALLHKVKLEQNMCSVRFAQALETLSNG
ncbi:phosphotransferase [Marinilongibacter aquaticus]|uniref:phosphotransferase n=1 Tax=Marinilongibacter aquaticus TaxID=2975157 RepID=UPI0021BD154A|nr:phosphotransferase [Marinilongibacter aquaticus]UBM59668.1 phosphotransferase [Marinilongibacter aquaticus]